MLRKCVNKNCGLFTLYCEYSSPYARCFGCGGWTTQYRHPPSKNTISEIGVRVVKNVIEVRREN